MEKNYMTFMAAFTETKPAPFEGGDRELDWVKIKEFIEKNKNTLGNVVAGLAEDWGHTSGEVWNAKNQYIPKDDTYVYGSSSWATPEIEVEYKNGKTEMLEMWKQGKDAHSYFELTCDQTKQTFCRMPNIWKQKGEVMENQRPKKQAIKYLKRLRGCCNTYKILTNMEDELDLAIKALESEITKESNEVEK